MNKLISGLMACACMVLTAPVMANESPTAGKPMSILDFAGQDSQHGATRRMVLKRYDAYRSFWGTSLQPTLSKARLRSDVIRKRV